MAVDPKHGYHVSTLPGVSNNVRTVIEQRQWHQVHKIKTESFQTGSNVAE